MKNAFCILLIAFVITCCPLVSSAQSDVKPIQISIWNPVQLFNSSTSIHGIRLILLYGVNQDIIGLDWVGVIHKVNGDMVGWQEGIINIVGGNVRGFQDGFVNYVKGEFWGLQTSIVNINKSRTIGLQAGFYNSTNDMNGVQFGAVNIAKTLYGLQIGIININKSGNLLKFLPIVNFSF
ncbi:LA_2272 family surface repeat-containing protein [Candidatus Latescibacterota bacterium]